MSIKVKNEKQFCKYCRGELFSSIEKECDGHIDCINALSSCDKCRTIEGPLKKLKHIYNPKLQILCLKCIESELKIRTDIMMKNIQNQYDLSKEEYKIKVKIEIAEVSYNES